MKQTGRGTSGSDLAAGVAAALAFLAMVFALGMNLLLAVVLAGAVYVGVALLGRQVQSQSSEPSEAELLQRIEQLLPAVTNPQVRRKITGLVSRSRSVLAYLQQHPDQDAGWRPVVRDCLASTQRITWRYVELSRFLDDSQRNSLADVEGLLDQVSETFANLQRRLVDEGAADLTSEMELFRSTLQAVNEVNVLRQGRGNP